MREDIQTIRMNENTWRFEEKNVRSFLFVGKERALLLDSGCEQDDALGMVRCITDLPVMLVNTHVDLDHIACNSQFNGVWMHPAEFALCRNEKLRREALRPLWDGDVIDLGGLTFEVIHIPGHTPGSIALLCRENRVLAAGDSVQNGRIYLFGRERSTEAYLASLERLKKRAGEFELVYACHSDCVIPAGIIADLIEGVGAVLRGNVPGKPDTDGGVPILVYDAGVARLLCDVDALYPYSPK